MPEVDAYYLDENNEEVTFSADLTDEELAKVKAIFEEALLRD